MTHRAAGYGHGVPRLWLLPIGVLTGMLGVTAAGILSRSLVLDLAAWWPVWLVVIAVALVAHGRHVGTVQAAGLVPLLATAALLVFLAGHLEGWPVMPSATPILVGPSTGGTTTAALSARIDGIVRISAGTDFLYEVGPVRLGGEIGVPEAVEQIQESAISIVLERPLNPEFYSFAGWDIFLSSVPVWNLTVAGEIEADLSGLQISEFQATGDGIITVGPVAQLTTVSIEGEFQLVVPPGVAARVIGDATVPVSWQQLSDGARSPTSGDGWLISVPDGSSLSVTDE